MTRLAPLVVAVAALAAQGCGGDAKSNGLENLPPAKVQRMAAAALESAGSAHVKGTGAPGGDAMTFDLRFDGASIAGFLETGGVRVAITRIGDDFYVRTGRQGLRMLGTPASTRRVAAGRWIKLGPEQITDWSGLALADLADQLSENAAPLDPGVTQAELDGERVVVVSQRDGSKLYVANTGAAYPLRGDYGGTAAGRLDFTEYGADFHITAPEDPLDLSDLPSR